MKVSIAVTLLLVGACHLGLADRIALIHMHGVSEHWRAHTNFKKHIESNTAVDEVYLIDAYNGVFSLFKIWDQVEDIREKVKKIAANYDRVIAVGYSQGGVIWRGIIETWDDHNVDTFIAIASPLAGVYGAPEIATNIVPWLESFSKTTIYWPIYYLLQHFGIFNYYKDPTNESLYHLKSKYLPDINNERGISETKLRYKRNFLKLRRLVMVGGPGDDVVDPWESTQFGFYTKDGFNAPPVTMRETEAYVKDLFGLKTLDERGGVVACTYNGINHLQFRDYPPMLDLCVVPAINEAVSAAN